MEGVRAGVKRDIDGKNRHRGIARIGDIRMSRLPPFPAFLPGFGRAGEFGNAPAAFDPLLLGRKEAAW
jgi:hypothetical protein